MQSTKLEEFVKSIFSNNLIRDRFMSDPESVVSESALSETEKKAVLDTHVKWGLAAGNSAQLEAAMRDTTGWLAPEQ